MRNIFFNLTALILQRNKTCFLITLLRMYIPRNSELGSALSKRWNFGGDPPPPGFGLGGGEIENI
jgi:hypothetical protein